MSVSETSTIGEHSIVRASAGSGKTYRLTSQYLRLLVAGVGPDQILATTFTRKAAGEIFGRTLSRLSAAAQDPKKTKELSQALECKLDRQGALRHLDELCQALHRVSVSTLDSFFYRLAMSFRLELGIGPRAVVVGSDDPRIQRLRLAAIESLLTESDLKVMVELLRRMHHDNINRSVSGAIDTIVSQLYEVYRAAPRIELWSALHVPQGLLDPTSLATAIDRLTTLEHSLPKPGWAKPLAKSLDAARNEQWELFIKDGIAKAIINDKTKYSSTDIPSAFLDNYRPLIAHAIACLLKQKSNQTIATFQLLDQFHHYYSKLRHDHGLLLYSDLPHKLAYQLSPHQLHEQIHYRMDAQIAHLLLDEHQDTSIEQWHVLKPFAQEIASYSDASRLLCVVGDVKQAIYGWRGGCAEIFDALTHDLNLPDDVKIDMDKSYRSSQIILDTVNDVFGHLADCDTLSKHQELARNWQGRFKDHSAHFDQRPGYVELATTAPKHPIAQVADDEDQADELAALLNQESNGAHETAENDDAPDTPNTPGTEDAQPTEDTDDPDDIEAMNAGSPHQRYVARRIKQMVDDALGHTMGVLCRTNVAVNRMLHLLQRIGVPASGEAGNRLDDNPAVLAVLSAMMMADHPGHSAAVFHVLHSPLAPIIGLLDDDPAHADQIALQLRTQLLTHGYGRVLSQWATALASSCDAHGVLRLTQLVELADAYEPSANLRPAEFVDHVLAAAVEEPTTASVRVMTVHKAKGLEFDIVVLAELDKRLLGKNDGEVYIDRATPADPIRAVYRSTNTQIRQLSPQLEQAHAQAQAGRLGEDICALYVAMTRPRYALYLFVEPLTLSKSGKPSKLSFSYANILRDTLKRPDTQSGTLGEALAAGAVADNEGYGGGQTLYEHGNPNWYDHLPKPKKTPAKQIAIAPAETTPIVSGQTPPEQVLQDQALEDIAPLFAAAQAEAAAKAAAEAAQIAQSEKAKQVPASSWPAGRPAVGLAPLSDQPRRSWQIISPSTQADKGKVRPAQLLALQKSSAAQRGTIIHGWFEEIQWLTGDKPQLDDQKLLDRARKLSPQSPLDDEDWLATILESFKQMLQRPGVIGALTRPDTSADQDLELWRERDFLVLLDDNMVKGQFDRVVITSQDGKPIRADLIDFKTDRIEPDESNIDTLIETYRPQMELYCRSLSFILNLQPSQITASLLLLQVGQLVKV